MNTQRVSSSVLDLAKKHGKITKTKRDGTLLGVDPNEGLVRGKREECLATWYHQATPGTTYWRCVVPARHLPGQVMPVDEGTLKEKRGKPVFPTARGNAVVWQFLGDEMRTKLAFGMRELMQVPLFMEVDDNYLQPAAYARAKGSQAWFLTKAEAKGRYSNEAHRELTPYLDGVICSTPHLAEAYSRFNPNVHVCPNSVDPDDWQYEREESDVFRIVYYGSPTHNWDAPLVTRALKWAARQPGVEVTVVGFKNPAWSFKHEVLPWVPWLDVARKQLFRFDLGIAPLKVTDWANGKSDVKILEYAMAGVCPLMSRAEPHRYWSDWEPLIVEDDEWEERIRWFVNNQDEARYLAEAAKSHVLETRSIEQSIGLWKEALRV